MRSLALLSLWSTGLGARWAVEKNAARATPGPTSTNAPWTNYTQTQLWLTSQKVDHFNAVDERTFSQRYWIVENFVDASTGPLSVILYLCGEYDCPGVMPTRLFPLELAYEHTALVVVLEHRFYGESQPFDSQATGYLPYLSSRQALEDLAYFSTIIQGQINANYSLPAEFYSKWLVVGGSYPGAMSAWYRIKYPHLTVGSLASSGVVNAFVEYPQFDQQVATSVGDACAAALRNVTASIAAAMPGIKADFQAAELEDGDFWFMVADAGAEGVQYGHKDVLCTAVMHGDSVAGFLNYTLNFWMAGMGNAASDYDSNVLSQPNAGDGRSWSWQYCTEFGWWQVAPASGSIRSANVNASYFSAFCSKLFGLPAGWVPDVDATNRYYGGAQPAGYNIFFSNGVEDPWRWASVQQTISPSEQAQVVDCYECGHCVDLYTPSPADAATLVAERDQVKQLVAQWMA